jgi:hypothetical protein
MDMDVDRERIRTPPKYCCVKDLLKDFAMGVDQSDQFSTCIYEHAL